MAKLTARLKPVIVIKSTVPVGYTEHARRMFQSENTAFRHQFRPGRACDEFCPAEDTVRLVVGRIRQNQIDFSRDGRKQACELRDVAADEFERVFLQFFAHGFGDGVEIPLDEFRM